MFHTFSIHSWTVPIINSIALILCFALILFYNKHVNTDEEAFILSLCHTNNKLNPTFNTLFIRTIYIKSKQIRFSTSTSLVTAWTIRITAYCFSPSNPQTIVKKNSHIHKGTRDGKQPGITSHKQLLFVQYQPLALDNSVWEVNSGN